MNRTKLICSAICVSLLSTSAYAHSGGLDQNGGHWNWDSNSYHCHKSYCKDKDSDIVRENPNKEPYNNGTTIADSANWKEGTRILKKVYKCKRSWFKLFKYRGRPIEHDYTCWVGTDYDTSLEKIKKAMQETEYGPLANSYEYEYMKLLDHKYLKKTITAMMDYVPD